VAVSAHGNTPGRLKVRTPHPWTRTSESRPEAIRAPSGPIPGQPVPTSAIHRLTVQAERVAKGDGDATPVWVSVVVTTRAKALTSATPGDTVPGDQNTIVYLVKMKGHFVDNSAPGPSGPKAPVGEYLSLVIDAKTFEGTDFGLSRRAPPERPGSFGPVTYLKVYASAPS